MPWKYTTPVAIKVFQRTALENLSFESRYGWDYTGHTEADVAVLWGALAARVPDNAKVLDLGCGGGGFSEVLASAKPGVTYMGVDAIIENVEAATAAFPTRQFEVGNLWEKLTEPSPTWDYVVSCHAAFSFTGSGEEMRLLLQLLDAKARRGFALITNHPSITAAGGQEILADIVSKSQGVTASYLGVDVGETIPEVNRKGMVSICINREGSADGLVAPDLTDFPELRCVATGDYNGLIGKSTQMYRMRGGADTSLPTRGIRNGSVVSDIPAEVYRNPRA